MRYLVLLLCCVATLFAASPAFAANLLQNPDFSTPGSGLAAESWLEINGPVTSLVNSGILPAPPADAYLSYGSNLISVTVGPSAFGGLQQLFLAIDSGPTTGFSEAAVFVISGTVYLGTGNGGGVGFDTNTQGVIGQWIILQAPFGTTPANSFILYGSPDAQFYVAAADVTPVPEPGSIVLLGSGLFGLAGLLRRRIIR